MAEKGTKQRNFSRVARYSSRSRAIIINVYNYFENENPRETVTNLEEKTASATQVSIRTVQRIRREHYHGVSLSPEPKQRPSYVVDRVDKESIRRELLLCCERDEQLTLSELMEKVKEPPVNYTGSRSSLYKIVKSMGFGLKDKKWQKPLMEMDVPRSEFCDTIKSGSRSFMAGSVPD